MSATNVEAPPRRTGSPRIIGRAASHENMFLLAIVAALVIVLTVLTPAGTFFSSTNFKNIALDTSEILVLAAGSTFVVIAAGIDLSIGSVVVFSAGIFSQTLPPPARAPRALR